MIYLIIGILVVVCLWKWLLFLVLAPIIIGNQKRNHLKWLRERDNLIKIQFNNSALETPNKSAFQKRVRIFVYRYIKDYTRYIDTQVSRIPSFIIRDFIYKHILLVDMHENVVLHYGAEIRSHSNLQIGKGTIIGDNALLDARNGIIMGANINLSSNVSIYTQQHDHRRADFGCSTNACSTVAIGDRVWIGPNVIILPGVTIGEGAVVGAGAVVNKDIQPYTINVGIPAKSIGDRTRNLIYQFQGEKGWFI